VENCRLFGCFYVSLFAIVWEIKATIAPKRVYEKRNYKSRTGELMVRLSNLCLETFSAFLFHSSSDAFGALYKWVGNCDLRL
jgi:hypothetical protein